MRVAAARWLLGAGWVALLAFAAAAVRAETPAEPVTAAELRSALDRERGRVLVVTLWATWCTPCLREIPDLLHLEAEMGLQNVRLIGIAVDDPTPGAREVEEFRRKYFPALRTFARRDGERDALASVIDPAWNEVVPTTYILDRSGKVRARIQGKKTLEEFKTAVRQVL
jgi:thiol-disulfide isomerase/thioredoxin